MIPLLLLAAQVTGVVAYEDRAYDNNGFTGVLVPRPVRQAEVEILRASDGAVLGTGSTNNAGGFSINGIPASTTVRARIYARGLNTAVRDHPSTNALYTALGGSDTTNGGGNASLPPLLLTVSSGAAAPFNIFDAAVKSHQLQALIDLDVPPLLPPLTLYWQPGSTLGTYFITGANAIHLLGTTSDPDEFDDDIILHEIGHWVAENFSRDETPGGPHRITDQVDPRLAWSEGWAHYWSAAVRRAFPGEYLTPSTQVDNFGGANSAFDIEGPSLPGKAVMATNELAVAAVLWDLIDPANESFDPLSGNDTDVWASFDDRMPLMTGITLEDFRDGLALEAPGIMADVTGAEGVVRIMNARLIRYYPDGSEPNGSPPFATPLGEGVALRTIYPSGDEDWFSMEADPGLLVAETFNLGDGASTLIQLFDTDGATILTSMVSCLEHRIDAPGTYYLRVTRAGTLIENGYYDLRARVLPIDTIESGYCNASSSAPAPEAAFVGLLLLTLGGILCLRRS